MVEYGWDQTPTPDLGLDITKAPEDIQKLYKWVIQKTYGQDVASAYAQGLVAAGIIAKNAEALSLFTSGKMEVLDQFVKDTLIELTDKDVISAPEIIMSRDGESTLSDRLDRDFRAINDAIGKKIKHLNYEMFGINGDKKYFNPSTGKYYLDETYSQEYTEDDGEAIRVVHELAAASGLPIVNVSGEYVIRKKRYIPVMTNTDLGNSVFHIDESDLEGFPFVFRVLSKFDEVEITPPVSTLKKRQLEIPEMAQFEGHIAIFEDENSEVGRRYNGTSTKIKRDLSYIGQGGTLDGEISWDYDQITKVTVRKVDETYLTFEGGNLVYSGYLTSPSSSYVHQGVSIERSKTIIKNQRVNYELVDASQATQYGLYQVGRCYDVTFDQVDLPSRLRTNGSSYGFTANLVTKLQFKNLRNFASGSYWGVMGTNDIKDMSFDNCDIGRIDTHFHLWGLTIKDTKTNAILVTGGGTLKVDRSEVRHNNNDAISFINFRDDFGSIWDGDISIENCKIRMLKPGNFNAVILRFGAPEYDYSQDIYWGRKITIDNFDIDYEAGNNDGKANILYFSNARNFGGRKPYYPSKITARNLNIHGRDKGYRFVNGTNLNETLAYRDGYYSISSKEVQVKPNAFYEFDSIYTTHEHNTSHSLEGHLGYNNGGEITNANATIPRIVIRNCKPLSISTGNLVCELIIENCEVSTIYAKKNARVKLISTDIKPNFNSVTTYPNALIFDESEVSYLGCKFFPMKHNDAVNMGWSIGGRLGIFSIGGPGRIVHKGGHVGTQLSDELFNYINNNFDMWSLEKRNLFFDHLRNSPMSAQYADIDYRD